MSKLSRDTQELIARGRSGPILPESERARLKRAVLAGIAVASTAATTTTTAAATWASLAAKLAGVVTLAGAVTLGAFVERSRVARTDVGPREPLSATTAAVAPSAKSGPRESPSPALPTPSVSTVETEAVSTVETEARPPVLAAAPSRAMRGSVDLSPSLEIHRATSGEPPPRTVEDLAPPRVGPSGVASAPPASWATAGRAATVDSLLGEEARLVRDANDAAKSGDTARALALLDEHAARFPQGALEPERSAERVFVLCAAGRTDEAHAARDAFLRGHASGPLAARVRASCAEAGK